MKYLLVLIFTGLLLGGCAPSIVGAPDLSRKEAATAAAPSTVVTGAFPTAAPADEAELVSLARADLATRLGVGIQSVSLVSIVQLAAADIYTGCTRKLGQAAMPDQSVNGYQIWLQAGDQRYVYHAEMPNVIIACEMPVAPTNHP